jgi:hypothetical protein
VPELQPAQQDVLAQQTYPQLLPFQQAVPSGSPLHVQTPPGQVDGPHVAASEGRGASSETTTGSRAS